MSQRPYQLPAVMTSQLGVINSTSAPIRLAISRATSTSKPSISFWSLINDCGGQLASVAILIVLVDIILSNTPPAYAAFTDNKPASSTVPSTGFNSFMLKVSSWLLF